MNRNITPPEDPVIACSQRKKHYHAILRLLNNNVDDPSVPSWLKYEVEQMGTGEWLKQYDPTGINNHDEIHYLPGGLPSLGKRR